MLKNSLILLLSITPLFANAKQLVWNNVQSNIDFAAYNQARIQNQQQLSQSLQQISDTYQTYAQEKSERDYDLAVHKIRQAGGEVEREGRNIYITGPDGSRIYCYERISQKTCEENNY